ASCRARKVRDAGRYRVSDNVIGRRRFLALAGLGAAGATLAACSNPTASWNAGSGSPSPGATGTVEPSASPTGTPAPTGAPVHVRLYQGDGSTWGVGMPIIAYLSKSITDSRAFNDATKVTVNGTAAQGAWFFQHSTIYKDYPLEAHYRMPNFWPA